MLFIFDWDGTLSDSTAKITQSMQVAAQDLGWEPLPAERIHNIIGLGLPEAILHLYPDVSDVGRLALRDRYSTNFLRLENEKASDFFPSVSETLSALRGRGHLLAVATGKSRKGLDRVLATHGLLDYFDATRCADETASKPHPLMLEELLQQFGVPVHEAVMIGDTEFDMDMARRIKMPRIAVSYGAHHLSRLLQYQPELCLDRIDALLAWNRLAN